MNQPAFVPPTFVQIQLSLGRILKIQDPWDKKEEFSVQISCDYVGNNYMRNVAFYSRFVNLYAFHRWLHHATYFIVKTSGLIIDSGEIFHRAILDKANERGFDIPDTYDSVVTHHNMWWFIKTGWQHSSRLPAY